MNSHKHYSYISGECVDDILSIDEGLNSHWYCTVPLANCYVATLASYSLLYY